MESFVQNPIWEALPFCTAAAQKQFLHFSWQSYWPLPSHLLSRLGPLPSCSVTMESLEMNSIHKNHMFIVERRQGKLTQWANFDLISNYFYINSYIYKHLPYFNQHLWWLAHPNGILVRKPENLSSHLISWHPASQYIFLSLCFLI